MRVLLDCRMATWSGVGRYSVGLARALARRDDVELVLAIAEGEAPPFSGAELHFAGRSPFGIAGARELGRIAREAGPDLTHCLHFPTPLPAPHPLVVTIHDLTPLLVPGIMPSSARRLVYRTWNARAARVADHIVADSACTAADLARLFPNAADRTTVVPLAADDFTAVSCCPSTG